jgi:hypothetical protein
MHSFLIILNVIKIYISYEICKKYLKNVDKDDIILIVFEKKDS